jgi:hypothetical protein
VSDKLRVTTDGAVRVVTIDRPQAPEALNVIKATLHHELREFLGSDKYDAIDTREG